MVQAKALNVDNMERMSAARATSEYVANTVQTARAALRDTFVQTASLHTVVQATHRWAVDSAGSCLNT